MYVFHTLWLNSRYSTFCMEAEEEKKLHWVYVYLLTVLVFAWTLLK